LKWHKVKEHDHQDCKDCKQLFVTAAAFKASGVSSLILGFFFLMFCPTVNAEQFGSLTRVKHKKCQDKNLLRLSASKKIK
jgi:hypothetical protein